MHSMSEVLFHTGNIVSFFLFNSLFMYATNIPMPCITSLSMANAVWAAVPALNMKPYELLCFPRHSALVALMQRGTFELESCMGVEAVVFQLLASYLKTQEVNT